MRKYVINFRPKHLANVCDHISNYTKLILIRVMFGEFKLNNIRYINFL